MASFGRRFRGLREFHGLNQVELAEKLSVANSTISQWESNKRMPDSVMLQQLADYFQVSVDYLLGRTDHPQGHAHKIEAHDNLGVSDSSESQHESLPVSIGRRIRQARMSKTWSQRELAAAASIEPASIPYWESGRFAPSEEELIKLASALGVAKEDLAPEGLPAPPDPEEVLKDLEIQLRSSGQGLSEQDVKEILDFVEFRKAQRAREEERLKKENR